MYLTNFLKLPQGHSGIDFIDIHTGNDTPLFLDPCLIELGDDPRSVEAAATIADFEDSLYQEMRSDHWRTTPILEQAHEIHDTKLGYGNGHNGKGKSSEGLMESLSGLYSLANQIPTISCIQDINLFVQDFAEDCMSDLLTNILRRQLCDFTNVQMTMYGKEPHGYHTVSYWNSNKHQWSTEDQPIWTVNGVPVLLVPKKWVRSRFLCTAHQYLTLVIIERMQEEEKYHDLAKKNIWQDLERETEHWEYDRVTDYTKCHPDALSEYHRRMLQRYSLPRGQMTDDELDRATYGYSVTEIA